MSKAKPMEAMMQMSHWVEVRRSEEGEDMGEEERAGLYACVSSRAKRFFSERMGWEIESRAGRAEQPGNPAAMRRARNPPPRGLFPGLAFVQGVPIGIP